MDNYNYNQLYDSPKKSKRIRIAFTTDQINYLENQFKKFAYIGAIERKEVAATLNIPEKAIKVWFQNRRMREKKESITKEVDDEQGIRKYLDFSKEQSNNVSVLSVNEQPTSSLSLPLLTDLMQENCYNTEGTKCSACKARQVVQGNEIKDSTVQIYAPDNLLSMTTAKVIHPPSAFVNTNDSSPNFKSTAEFSIDLCKKYKTESSTKLIYEAQQFFKTESEDVKKMEGSKPVGFTGQVMSDNTLFSMTTAKATRAPSASGKSRHSSPNFKTTAEFSIDLWKKYKNKSSTKSFYEEQSFKIESENIKKLEESKTVGFTEQMMPEDLSPRRKRNVAAICPQQPVPGNASGNSGFVSLVPTVPSVYTQPYISTSGVLLKPVSVIPVVNSNSSAVAVPCNPLLNVCPVQDYYAKKPCNCDCQCTRKQVVPQIQYNNIPQQSQSPQYIIALPFQKPATKY